MHTSLLALGLLVCICSAVPLVDDDIDLNRSKVKFRDILKKYVNSVNTKKTDQTRKQYWIEHRNLTLLGFSWSNCGSTSDTIQVHSLDVSPDPITIPGEEKVRFDITVTTNVTKPTKLEMIVQKKLFGIFVIVGSRTFNDPCSLLEKITTCPEAFKEIGITCHCPFTKGEFKQQSIIISIPKLPLPPFIGNGEYKLQGTLYDGNTRLGCYEVDASLKHHK